jgi:hypothetical protein
MSEDFLQAPTDEAGWGNDRSQRSGGMSGQGTQRKTAARPVPALSTPRIPKKGARCPQGEVEKHRADCCFCSRLRRISTAKLSPKDWGSL